jgi:hypothetical protein
MQQAPPRSQTQPAAACPNCGAPAAADQLFCLECGERIGIGYRRPPSWRLPAAIVTFVLLLAGAAVAVALIEVSDEAGEVASAPGPNAPPPAATQPGTEGTQGDRTEREEETPAPAEETAANGEIAEWPDDTSAYTVILLSTNTRAGAEAVARQAARAGIPAGVLQSDDYSSLNPGYWVAFGGEFESSEEAQREAESYAGLGFAGGYPRFVNGGGGSG